jgi:hypothetical protein
MNTFLPFKGFSESARSLDSTRLNNQINEATVIWKSLTGLTAAWRFHPAVRMWRCFEPALLEYRDACIQAGLERGIKITTEPIGTTGALRPTWTFSRGLHFAYRAKLHGKDPVHYAGFAGFQERDPFPYPVPDLEYRVFARRAEKCKTLSGKTRNGDKARWNFPTYPVPVEYWPEGEAMIGPGTIAWTKSTALLGGIPQVKLSGVGDVPMSRVIVLGETPQWRYLGMDRLAFLR